VIVIAHRGASAYRPEHTLASYELAIAMGADFIEPDLVATRDGELVARHENDITHTTDVATRPEFAGRRATRTIDGREHDGWFTEDFTLAELRTLRATERIPEVRPANATLGGRFTIPALQEVIDLARRARVGIYPETKHPAYFRSIGLALEEPLAAALRRNHLDRPDAPVFLQSFDPDSLRRLAALVDAPRVQLTAPRLPALALEDVAGYAQAVGPEKSQVSATFAADAHRAGLLVHAWVFRPEDADTEGELRRFMELGVDGVFADHPDTAVAVREAWARGR
jgi:glycerophosphoryl diester phosphodiesterase